SFTPPHPLIPLTLLTPFSSRSPNSKKQIPLPVNNAKYHFISLSWVSRIPAGCTILDTLMSQLHGLNARPPEPQLSEAAGCGGGFTCFGAHLEHTNNPATDRSGDRTRLQRLKTLGCISGAPRRIRTVDLLITNQKD
ncbi:MAG: hypothetical protein ACFNZE_05720, partial [Scardovia wiggsiae]